ncbi:MAG: heterodisulfide reductase-related iron-sulfur binding cluster [Methanosarcinales archaeon]
MSEYALFLGCTIPARFPYLEKSIRMVLEELGVKYRELEGFTCCPTKTIIGIRDKSIWYLTAARNLAIAEKEGLDILTPCNGCYASLKSALQEERLNNTLIEGLNKVGLELKGEVQVKHLIEVLRDEVGIEKIKSHIEEGMEMYGLNLAVHYGCHLVRPSSAIHFDDPIEPNKLDALVEATGAKSIEYENKMMCCGSALSSVDEEGSIALMRDKILNLQDIADALVLTCPSCFMQFDSKQYLLKKAGETLNIPVIYISELLGLAMGFSPKELGIEMHRIEIKSFIEKWKAKRKYYASIREHFPNLADLKTCYDCGACVQDCPVAKITYTTWDPKEIIGRILNGENGELEALINSEEIWKCLDCYTCYELCPQKFGMNKVFEKLKAIAGEKGCLPQPLDSSINLFLKTGMLGEPTKIRKKLKLPELKKSGAEELKKLLEHCK